MDESKLIFFTGAPGSKWSATAHILSHNKILPINTSDYADDRVYAHPRPSWNVKHLGAYWGPGFGWGDKFDKIDQLSKDEIIAEIDKPYADKRWDKYRIIKCHQFANNLDFIRETFPESKIMIVLRPNAVCANAWIDAGGWNITYPVYKPYYKDNDTLRVKVSEELQNAKGFITQHNLEMQVITDSYWLNRWGIEKNTPELELYMNSITRSPKDIWHYDTTVAEI